MLRTAALVLAAGRGVRFGRPGKLMVPLDGQPILQHVLDAVFGAGTVLTVVVMGNEAESMEHELRWRGELRVRNPAPEDGLSGSLRLGMQAVEGADPGGELEAVLVVLGDQPRARAQVMHDLMAAGTANPRRPIVVPRYRDGAGSHPVLLRRSVWPLALAARGDRGIGQAIAARPDLVVEVPFPGANPDIDTPADLAAIAGDLTKPPAAT